MLQFREDTLQRLERLEAATVSGKIMPLDRRNWRRMMTKWKTIAYRQAPHILWSLLLLVALGIIATALFSYLGWFPERTDASFQASADWPPISLVMWSDGLSRPVHIANAGDNSERLFVVEQAGRIRIIKDGALWNTPFLDIASRVSCCGERGLLSVAFPPDYASKGYFYVDYTDTSGDTVIARYGLTGDPDAADPDSEQVILTVDQPYANHNGGQLAFGPDGYLYIGMGDGGSAGDPGNYAQNPDSLLGKILRIDTESPGDPATYVIPPTNPYTQTAGYRGEIWALGLRNPWRFSFDRQTGDLYIGDVGQSSYEEIDYQPASSPGGENYGWKIMEGSHCYNAQSCDDSGLTPPVWEYSHAEGCSVTGGMVYRESGHPSIYGIYLYGDYCSGRIWGLKHDGDAWQNALLYDADFRIASFGEDESGYLYVTDYLGGAIYRIMPLTRNVYLPLAMRNY